MNRALNDVMVDDEEGIRLARRRRIESEVVLRDPEGHGEVVLRCRDVSVNGLFVYSSACARPGSEFICCLTMEEGLVEAPGRVARVVLDADAPERSGMGIKFTRLAGEVQDKLLRFTAPTQGAASAAMSV